MTFYSFVILSSQILYSNLVSIDNSAVKIDTPLMINNL